MPTTVHVSGISSQTSEKEVRDFFSFCGKIADLNIDATTAAGSGSKDATVTFEKESAAKTALLLDNTQLGPAQVKVTASSSSSFSDEKSGGAGTSSDSATKEDDHHIAQEDKPRARVLAEYLAHGYVVSDKAIENAIALDQQHGVSNRFLKALTDFDNKYKVSEKTAAVDQQYGISARAQQGWAGLASYFEQAANTPTGQKVRGFYEQGSKQVIDVHNEAKHLASLKSGKAEEQLFGAGAAKKPTPEEAEMEKVEIEGKEKTKCNCGGSEGVCPCEPGKCACNGCAKAS